MNGKTELAEVWVAAGDGDHFDHTVGERGVTRIVIVADGQGLSGYYDRIHVYHKRQGHWIFPAHNCVGWKEAAPIAPASLSE